MPQHFSCCNMHHPTGTFHPVSPDAAGMLIPAPTGGGERLLGGGAGWGGGGNGGGGNGRTADLTEGTGGGAVGRTASFSSAAGAKTGGCLGPGGNGGEGWGDGGGEGDMGGGGGEGERETSSGASKGDSGASSGCGGSGCGGRGCGAGEIPAQQNTLLLSSTAGSAMSRWLWSTPDIDTFTYSDQALKGLLGRI